jgi:hypothetical protein
MIKLISCIGIDYDLPLLPHFIKHYSKLDIDVFHFILHSKHYSKLSKENFDMEQLSSIPQKLKIEKWIGVFDGVTKTNKLNKIIENTKESYIVMADVDEFQRWDQPLKSYNRTVWGILQDRESVERTLNPVDPGESLEIQYPVKTKRTVWDPEKPCLFPSTDRLLSPHHLRDNKYIKDESNISVDHYRWVSGRVEKSKERKKVYDELKKKCVMLESGIWGQIPNWESQNIINQFREKTLL